MNQKENSSIVLYASSDGQVKVDVFLKDETVWLTQKQMAELYQTTPQNVTLHLKTLYAEEELDGSTCKEYLQVQKEGGREISRNRKFYNLRVILAVGYRVRSQRGTQFRIWATQRLEEYLVKGFALDDERLKQGGQKARYFQELLQRIRDIRSSERNFYQKVTDIYATSIDYRKDDQLTREFFATVQNKIHYAIHGHTAAEIISNRADSRKPMMGLTSFKGSYITAQDVKVAKNYLTEKELMQLNLIVSLYLDFAELQATNGRLMKMADWIAKLDDFLRLSERRLLVNSGSVTAEHAAQIAFEEFEKYRKERGVGLVSDFDKMVEKSKLLEKKPGRKRKA